MTVVLGNSNLSTTFKAIISTLKLIDPTPVVPSGVVVIFLILILLFPVLIGSLTLLLARSKNLTNRLTALGNNQEAFDLLVKR